MPAGRIRIQVAADESQFIDAALELCGTVDRRHSRRLRQLADTDEVVGIQAADSMNQIVAGLRPAAAGRFVADMVGHGRRARRENRQVGAACALQFQLRVLQAVADLIVADDARGGQRYVDAGLEPGNLFIAKLLQRSGRRRVVAMTIDDHRCVQYMRVGFSTRICCRLRGVRADLGKQINQLAVVRHVLGDIRMGPIGAPEYSRRIHCNEGPCEWHRVAKRALDPRKRVQHRRL